MFVINLAEKLDFPLNKQKIYHLGVALWVIKITEILVNLFNSSHTI